jgi:SAM-dependent methyltransferase
MPDGKLKPFDRVADVYDDTRGVPDDAATQIGEAIARIACEVAPRPRLLEVGVGTGRIAVPVARAGVRVAGIDIAPAMIARLREKTREVDAVYAESARPPFRDGAFDALLFVHILHLVPDAAATLDATLPLLHAGGVVIYGRDEGRIGLRGEADRLIREAAHEIAGVDLASWDVHEETGRLVEATLAARCDDVRTETFASWSTRGTGRRMLERLRRKDFSSSWKIPDAALPAVVERVTPQLDALYGGLDTEHDWPRSFVVVRARLR